MDSRAQLSTHSQLSKTLQSLVDNVRETGVDFKQNCPSDGNNYFFVSNTLTINASAETVFKTALQIKKYNEFSDGAINAWMKDKGEFAVGKTICLSVKGLPFVAKVTVIIAEEVKKNCFYIGWSYEKFPVVGGYSLRLQIIKGSPDGKTCTSVIGDSITGSTGRITSYFWRDPIVLMFNKLNTGIGKTAAEEKAQAEEKHSESLPQLMMKNS